MDVATHAAGTTFEFVFPLAAERQRDAVES